MTCTLCQTPIPAGAAACPGCGVPAAAGGRCLVPGTQLQNGRYSVGKMLGEGGFGIAYKGVHRELKQPVAIKELFPDRAQRRGVRLEVSARQASGFDAERRRTLAEARAAAAVDSPHVVKVSDAFTENNTVYIVMEYLKGRSLREELDIRVRLPSKRVLKIARHLCEALTAVHGHNLLHRDVKPDNVMLTSDGRTVLVDFGSARVFRGDRTVNHTRILSTDYAAPEMFGERGRFGPPTDLYCLAATLYEALTGAPPPSVVDRLQGARLADVEALHADLGRTIVQALQVDATARPRTAAAFMAGCLAGTAPKGKGKRKNKGKSKGKQKNKGGSKRKNKGQGKGKQKNGAGARGNVLPGLPVVAAVQPHIIQCRPPRLRSHAQWSTEYMDRMHLEFHPSRPLLAAAFGSHCGVWDGDRQWGQVDGHAHTRDLRKLAWSPNVSECKLAMVDRLWNILIGDCDTGGSQTVNNPATQLHDMAFFGIDRLVGYSDKAVLINWSLRTGAMSKQRLTHWGRRPRHARFTHDGRRLAGWWDRTLCVWDVDSGRRLHAHRSRPISFLALGPGGRQLLTREMWPYGKAKLCFWNLHAGGRCSVLPSPHRLRGGPDNTYRNLPEGAMWSPCGDVLAYVTIGHLWHARRTSYNAHIQNPFNAHAEAPRPLEMPFGADWQWPPYRHPVGVFSPTGFTFAIGMPEMPCIPLWNTYTGALRTVLPASPAGTAKLAAGPDGCLAAAGMDGTVRVWHRLADLL